MVRQRIQNMTQALIKNHHIPHPLPIEMDNLDGYALSYKASSTPDTTLHKLKGGKIPVDQTLHLRGMTQDEAKDSVCQILASTQKQTLFLLIHGKGHQSEHNVPKLKLMLLDFLHRHPQVIAYCPASSKDGGSGALYLLATRSKY